MANLSQDDRNVIAKHPLDNSLDHLRDSLQAEQSYEPSSTSYDAAGDNRGQGPLKAVSRLLNTLQGHDVALTLRSKIAAGDLASELYNLFRRVRNGDFNYKHYLALSRLVVRKAPDVDIWNAVFDLITTVSRTTPPTSIPLSCDGTPITHSSASQQASEQTRREVEKRVFEEIMGCTFRNVEGFFPKYFEGKDWTERTKEIYRAVQHRHVNGRWTDFPHPPVQNALLEWWFAFQKEFLADARGVYYTSESSKDLTGAEARRQLDVFVKPSGKNISNTVHDWKDVEVIGELRESDREWKVKLLQLGRYMRDVFATQPTRRFIHGFTLLGSTMELWVFDRSGPYSSGVFDIHKEPEQFIRAIAGYTMMSDEELGLDTFTDQDKEYRSITITEDGTDKETRLQLEPDLIAYQRAIVCRGTSCFRAGVSGSQDSRYVVKFSWTSDKRQSEADLLRLARERGVKGVAKLFGHRCITNIADMREGLTFTKMHNFRNTTFSPSFSQSQPQNLLCQSFSQLHGLSIAGGSPRKRKSVDAGGRPSKRSRSNIQRSDMIKQEKEVTKTVEDTQTASLYGPNESSFDNRIFRCLVISPAGRGIRDFQSTKELLEALRDAIKAHRSLYLVGNILHRDISENNIIITDPKKADGFTGMLIDLDLAKKMNSGRGGARHQTGTMEFMAIEVLRRVAHTYRHDLESFFYVLLWICARRAWEREFGCKLVDRPRKSILTKWYTGDYDDIARSKRGDMGVDGFEELLEELPQIFDCVKPLCREIRGILFPYKDGLFTGTPLDPEELYGPILKAFDKAIAEITRAEGSLG